MFSNKTERHLIGFLGVRDFFDDTVHNGSIGRGGHIDWPLRLPDMTPIDFFFWTFVTDNAMLDRSQI